MAVRLGLADLGVRAVCGRGLVDISTSTMRSQSAIDDLLFYGKLTFDRSLFMASIAIWRVVLGTNSLLVECDTERIHDTWFGNRPFVSHHGLVHKSNTLRRTLTIAGQSELVHVFMGVDRSRE